MKDYTLGQLTKSISDGKHGGCLELSGSGYYFISVKDLADYEIDYSRAKQISKEDFDETVTRANIQAGDTVYANTGDTIGKCIFIRENALNSLTTFQKSVAILKANTEIINPRYLFYLLKSETKGLREAATGSAQKNLLLSSMRNYKVRIPEQSTQTKISGLLASLDDKIYTNILINQNLSQQLRLIFQHAFLDEEHPEWRVEKLGSFLSLERGLSYKGKFLSDSEGVPMVNLGNILPNSVFRPEKLKFYTGDFKSKVIVKPGDIVVANTDLTQAREVLGSAILIPDLGYPTIICSHHISIVRDCRISKYFIHGMLNSPSYRERVIRFATGTTVLALPSETILNCEFALPPNELIAEYDAIAESFYLKTEQLRKENQQLTQLRDTLLPRLMSGQLDVSEVPL